MTKPAPFSYATLPGSLENIESQQKIVEESLRNYDKQVAENKPIHEYLWYDVLRIPAVLECLSEISSTEFDFDKKPSTTILEVYQQQHENFVLVRKPELEALKVAPMIIDRLEHLYFMRSKVSWQEVREAFRITSLVRFDPQKRTWRLTTNESYSELRAKSWSENFPSNEEAAAANVRRFRAYVGLVSVFVDAKHKAELPALRKHLIRCLEASVVTPEKNKQLVEKLHEYRNTKGKGKAQLLKDLVKENTDNRGALVRIQELLNTKVDPTEVVTHPTAISSKHVLPRPTEADISGFKSRLQEAIDTTLAKDNSETTKKRAKELKELTDSVLDPETQETLYLLHLFDRSVGLNPEQMENLIEPFLKFDPLKDVDDGILNNVINPSPVAAKLWGDRLAMFGHTYGAYQKTFVEGQETLYHHIDSDPRFRKFLDNTFMDPFAYPFNSAVEEIIHLKLERLAEDYFGFDLSTDAGQLMFENFVHAYDISPGEDTLDRTHSYPPAFHTYEELPIIKFDGWDEADVPEDYEEYQEYMKQRNQSSH